MRKCFVNTRLCDWEGDLGEKRNRGVETHLSIPGERGSTNHIRNLDGIGKHTTIRSNDLEGQWRVDIGGGSKVQGERSRDSRIEQTEAIFARLDVQEGPRLTVHVDDIAPQAHVLVDEREQRTISVVLFGGQDQRDVVFAVARGQAEGILLRVRNYIRAGLAAVSVLSSLYGQLVSAHIIYKVEVVQVAVE